MKELTLKIAGMHCKGCALGLEGALEDLAQVSSVTVDFEKQQANITVQEALLDMDAIHKAVEKAGFSVIQ